MRETRSEYKKEEKKMEKKKMEKMRRENNASTPIFLFYSKENKAERENTEEKKKREKKMMGEESVSTLEFVDREKMLMRKGN